ncbi:MAG: hypothetical protein HY821_03930 [Acidobacteria bacterium]|nr:hypothetical protein [Acidobacteriota bacterium]
MSQPVVSVYLPRGLRLLLGAIAALLAIIAVRPFVEPGIVAHAESRFDYVQVLSTSWMRNGRPGILLMDRRNGNVWHMATQSDRGPGLGDPQFILRVPFEKLDQTPAGRQ